MSSKNKIDRLYAYIMTYDTEFAPNPFFGICTLACCKPKLRSAVVNYIEKTTSGSYKDADTPDLNIWIAGLAGTTLAKKSKFHNKGDIIYLMQVTDIITFEEYSKDLKFSSKIPDSAFFTAPRKNYCTENISYQNCGDNIYDFHGDSIQQRPSFHKNCGNSCVLDMKNDLSSKYVLLSSHYIYFGETPISPGDFCVKNNRGYSSNYTENERNSFCDFINTLDFKKVIQGKPTECADNFKWDDTRPQDEYH